MRIIKLLDYNWSIFGARYINSWLSRYSAARGSGIKLSLVGPTNVKARKSLLVSIGVFISLFCSFSYNGLSTMAAPFKNIVPVSLRGEREF